MLIMWKVDCLGTPLGIEELGLNSDFYSGVQDTISNILDTLWVNVLSTFLE